MRNVYYEREQGDMCISDSDQWYMWGVSRWVPITHTDKPTLITMNRLMKMAEETYTSMQRAIPHLARTPDWDTLTPDDRYQFAQALRPALVHQLNVYLEGMRDRKPHTNAPIPD